VDAVNMLEAKSTLSRLVEAVESGREQEIVIARNGRPVARLVAYHAPRVDRRIGVARGRFVVPDDIDASNAEVAALFAGTPAAGRTAPSPKRRR
jgi:prevent-host-death family protein